MYVGDGTLRPTFTPRGPTRWRGVDNGASTLRFDKLGVSDRTQAAVKAVELSLLSPEQQ